MFTKPIPFHYMKFFEVLFFWGGERYYVFWEGATLNREGIPYIRFSGKGDGDEGQAPLFQGGGGGETMHQFYCIVVNKLNMNSKLSKHEYYFNSNK